MTNRANRQVRVAAYARVSTRGQLEIVDNSLDTQMRRIRKYVDALYDGNGELVAEYREEGRSAGSADRPMLRQLMADATAGKFDVLFFTKLDRFTRSIRDFHNLWDVLDEVGVQIRTIDDHLDTSTATGRAFINILLTFAQHEREQLSERVRVKIQDRKREGKRHGGQIPIGYERHPTDSTTLAVHEEGAAIVRFAFEKFLEDGTIRGTARALRARGYTRPERTNKNGDTKPAKPIPNNTVARMLANRHYIAQDIAGDGSTIECNWPPIIERDVFERVQRLLEANGEIRSFPRANKAEVLLLEGLLRCGRCGAGMTYARHDGRGGVPYFYYRCTTAKNREGCATRNVPARAVEGFVLDALRSFSVDAATLEAAVKEANAGRDDEVNRHEREASALRRSLADNRARATNLIAVMMKLGDEVPLDVIRAARELEKERAEIEDGIALATAKLAAVSDGVLASREVADGFLHFHQLFDEAERGGARSELRDLLRTIIDVVQWDEDPTTPKRGTATIRLFPPLMGLMMQKTKQPDDGSSGCSTWLRMGSGPLPLSDGARRDTLSAALLAVPFSASPSPRARSVC